jgi:hypothetical protein
MLEQLLFQVSACIDRKPRCRVSRLSGHHLLFHTNELYRKHQRILWRDRGRAVGMHARQDSGIGRHIAVGSRNGRPVGRSQCIAQNTQNRVASTVTNVV